MRLNSPSSASEPPGNAPSSPGIFIKYVFPWLCLVQFLALSALFFPVVVDDAFITARYAENLVDHGQWVFNLGEPISALTSPLHSLIEAGLYAAFANSMTAFKFVAFFLVLMTTGLCAGLLRREPRYLGLFLVLTLSSPFLIFWTTGGLETPLLFALVTGMVLLLGQRGPELGLTGTATFSTIVALAFLTRYDSAVFTAPAVLMVIGWRWGAWRILLGLVPGILIVAGWLLFSNSYFGDIMPTSFYVKTPTFDLFEVAQNTGYSLNFFLISGLFLPVIPLLFRRSARETTRHSLPAVMRKWLWLFAGVLGVICYGFTAAATHMMFTYRFFVPYLAAAALLVILICRAAGWLRNTRSLATGLLLVGLLAAQTGLGLLVYHETLNPAPVDPRYLGFAHGFEYADESAKSYAENFCGAMRKNAEDSRRHWNALPDRPDRPARVLTYAGGVVPYIFRDTYIMEVLISYRHNCPYEVKDLQMASDYIQILVPRHGSVQKQLSELPGDLEQVSSHEVPFDGSLEKFMIFYQPHPTDNFLPPDIDGPCRPKE